MIHVYPLGDERDHTMEFTCECHPEFCELDEGEFMLLHNSFDHRELVEEANRILNQ